MVKLPAFALSAALICCFSLTAAAQTAPAISGSSKEAQKAYQQIKALGAQLDNLNADIARIALPSSFCKAPKKPAKETYKPDFQTIAQRYEELNRKFNGRLKIIGIHISNLGDGAQDNIQKVDRKLTLVKSKMDTKRNKVLATPVSDKSDCGTFPKAAKKEEVKKEEPKKTDVKKPDTKTEDKKPAKAPEKSKAPAKVEKTKTAPDPFKEPKKDEIPKSKFNPEAEPTLNDNVVLPKVPTAAVCLSEKDALVQASSQQKQTIMQNVITAQEYALTLATGLLDEDKISDKSIKTRFAKWVQLSAKHKAMAENISKIHDDMITLETKPCESSVGGVVPAVVDVPALPEGLPKPDIKTPEPDAKP